MVMDDHETVQWLLLLGAMLGNKAIRTEAAKRLANDDVPEKLKTLWSAIKLDNAESVRSGLEQLCRVKSNGEGVVAGLMFSLQEQALRNYVKKSVGRSQTAGLLEPEQAANFFEALSAQLRARMEQLEYTKHKH